MNINLIFPQRIFTMVVLIATISSCSHDRGWTSLLDKNLSQWNTYEGYKLPDGYKGEVPRDANGDSIPPFGYNKNVGNVFTVVVEDGKPVLRVSGEIYGCVFTKKDYKNYDLRLQVKWGKKKWIPRTEKLRDSGILYNSTGACGVDYWRAWMLSQEFQIMEGHMGDYWSQATSAMDIRAYMPEGVMNPEASVKEPFLPVGAGSGNGGFCMHAGDFENPVGEWNQVELICFEDKSIHIVNGHVEMVLKNSRQIENGKIIPLVGGKIQLQSEGAEVYYKDIEIKSIDAIPEPYAPLFN